jgi:hypothetical protein
MELKRNDCVCVCVCVSGNRSMDGLTSILPLKDGKTVLLFGVAHNGDLGMMTASDRTYGPPGRFSTLSVFHSRSFLCGAFVWAARRALRSPQRWFPAPAVYSYAKDAGGAPQPRPRIGISFALKSTDWGLTFAKDLISLDGPFTNQPSMVCPTSCEWSDEMAYSDRSCADSW